MFWHTYSVIMQYCLTPNTLCCIYYSSSCSDSLLLTWRTVHVYVYMLYRYSVYTYIVHVYIGTCMCTCIMVISVSQSLRAYVLFCTTVCVFYNVVLYVHTCVLYTCMVCTTVLQCIVCMTMYCLLNTSTTVIEYRNDNRSFMQRVILLPPPLVNFVCLFFVFSFPGLDCMYN